MQTFKICWLMQGQNPDNTEHSLTQQARTALDYSSLFKDPPVRAVSFKSLLKALFRYLKTFWQINWPGMCLNELFFVPGGGPGTSDCQGPLQMQNLWSKYEINKEKRTATSSWPFLSTLFCIFAIRFVIVWIWRQLQQDGALKKAGSQVFPHPLKLEHTHMLK